MKETGATIMTGCPDIPRPDSKFCGAHQNEDHPVISGTKMNLRNRDNLKKFRHEANSEAGDDDFYIIESILEINENEKTGKKIKVKWYDFPMEQSTWEDESTIPKFIPSYYDDISKLGLKLLAPVIKTSKEIGNNEYYYLSWTGEKGGG